MGHLKYLHNFIFWSFVTFFYYHSHVRENRPRPCTRSLRKSSFLNWMVGQFLLQENPLSFFWDSRTRLIRRLNYQSVKKRCKSSKKRKRTSRKTNKNFGMWFSTVLLFLRYQIWLIFIDMYIFQTFGQLFVTNVLFVNFFC